MRENISFFILKKLKKRLILYHISHIIIRRVKCYGGVAQLVRATGSYPVCRGSESLRRHHYLDP